MQQLTRQSLLPLACLPHATAHQTKLAGNQAVLCPRMCPHMHPHVRPPHTSPQMHVTLRVPQPMCYHGNQPTQHSSLNTAHTPAHGDQPIHHSISQHSPLCCCPHAASSWLRAVPQEHATQHASCFLGASPPSHGPCRCNPTKPRSMPFSILANRDVTVGLYPTIES
ncbi:hypothetical protein ACOSP7_013493 [Xanthoceras sorbifolium]